MFWGWYKGTKGDRDIDGKWREGRRERCREGGRYRDIDRYGVREHVFLGGWDRGKKKGEMEGDIEIDGGGDKEEFFLQ